MGEVFFFSGTKGCDLSLLIGSCEGSHGLWRTYKVKKRSWEMQALIVRSESCLSSLYPVDKLTQIVHNKPPVNKCERKKILFPRGADDRFFLNVVVEFENPC